MNSKRCSENDFCCNSQTISMAAPFGLAVSKSIIICILTLGALSADWAVAGIKPPLTTDSDAADRGMAALTADSEEVGENFAVRKRDLWWSRWFSRVRIYTPHADRGRFRIGPKTSVRGRDLVRVRRSSAVLKSRTYNIDKIDEHPHYVQARYENVEQGIFISAKGRLFKARDFDRVNLDSPEEVYTGKHVSQVTDGEILGSIDDGIIVRNESGDLSHFSPDNLWYILPCNDFSVACSCRNNDVKVVHDPRGSARPHILVGDILTVFNIRLKDITDLIQRDNPETFRGDRRAYPLPDGLDFDSWYRGSEPRDLGPRRYTTFYSAGSRWTLEGILIKKESAADHTRMIYDPSSRPYDEIEWKNETWLFFKPRSYHDDLTCNAKFRVDFRQGAIELEGSLPPYREVGP